MAAKLLVVDFQVRRRAARLTSPAIEPQHLLPKIFVPPARWTQHMETIQIVLDTRLLHATDQAARRTKRNRSALIRDALREHLRRLEVRAKEERDCQGYSRQPHASDESLVWEAEAAWPAE